MAVIDSSSLDFRLLDRFAGHDTPVHRLDPRAKLLVTLCFIVTVVSFGKYELSALVPFFIFPFVMISLGELPARYLARKVAVVLPFALLIGILNPLIDRSAVIDFGSVVITGGWLSCASIVVRAMLTVSAALILLAITGFPAICAALERLGMPRVFAVQLQFLYRYSFVLMEEGKKTALARSMRSFGARGLEMKTFGSLAGHLLLRTWERADRIHRAMLARGFSGDFHVRTTFSFGLPDAMFLLGWLSLFILFRFVNIPRVLGTAVTGLFS